MAMQFTYIGKPTPEQAIAQGIRQFVCDDLIVMKEGSHQHRCQGCGGGD